MDLDTNVQRVENMIYYICGCTIEEGKIVLDKCIERNKNKYKEVKFNGKYKNSTRDN